MSWVLLAAGLVLAGIAGLLVFTVARAPASGGTVEQRTDVVVAASDVRELTVLRPEMLALRSYRVENVPPGAITDVSAAVGRTTVIGIPAGIVVTDKALSTGSARGVTASLTLPAGMVLIVFPTSDSLSAAKEVQPGDKVDIQASLPVGPNAALVTQMIVQDLEVVAVADGRPTLLTFVVDRQTSLVLKYLRDTQAQMDLVVRSRSDTGPIRADAVDLDYLVKTYGVQRAK